MYSIHADCRARMYNTVHQYSQLYPGLTHLETPGETGGEGEYCNNGLCAGGCNHSKNTKMGEQNLLPQFFNKLNTFFIKFWEYIDTKSTIIYTKFFFLS